jgi:hypothetical protein
MSVGNGLVVDKSLCQFESSIGVKHVTVQARAGEEVSVWVYESTLKIEYQTTALALYSVRLSQDQQITEVTNPRRLETRFRSPQLDLWQLSDTEWLLALRRPEPGPRKKRSKIVALAEQLVLPAFGATG